jgi:hypothetical protein
MANQYTFRPLCAKDELIQLYVEQRWSQTEIAMKFEVSVRKVQGNMRRFGIKPRGAAKRDQTGPKNSRWKGVAGDYKALHLRVYSARGAPKHCERCGLSDESRRYEWANLTGRYEDPSDYRRLCVSCHRKFDLSVRGSKPGKAAIHERALALRGGGRLGFGGGNCVQ